MTYGYCRISRKEQSIERQIRNIAEYDSKAKIYTESFTGTKDIDKRPEFQKLVKRLKSGDTVVFDSVSRMSRNAEEGWATYEELYNRGVNLVFLKEHYCDTETYAKAMQKSITMTGTAIDCILQGINEYFRVLAKEQVTIAFEQAQKEVDDLHQRTKEGMETARQNGKQIGQKEGATLITKKSVDSKAIIREHSKKYGGTLNDAECMKLAGIKSRNTFYKYIRELNAEG